jgi:hypothetical protein
MLSKAEVECHAMIADAFEEAGTLTSNPPMYFLAIQINSGAGGITNEIKIQVLH